jgi:phosphoglycolate phosphatase
MDARALVFDLDGTLVDSLGDIAHHLNDALAEHGLPTHDPAQIGDWVGLGTDHLIAHAVERPELRVEVAAAYRSRYRSRPVIATHVYPDLAGVLDGLAGRSLAILSNKPHDLVVDIADALLARWRFRVIAGERAGRPKKPAAGSVLSVLAALGVPPGEAVMIGDSEIDVETAHAGGLTSIAVAWGFRPRERLAGADLIVDTPAALAAALR